MNTKTKEPKRLRHGKKFHRKLQNIWYKTATGKVKHEKGIVKPSGKNGRIDIFVDADDNLVAVVEIKASEWDAMTLTALRRNVSRYASQIWDYIESQLAKGKDVSPGVIFPKKPKNPDRIILIEQLFDERGIPIVWENESIEERKTRSVRLSGIEKDSRAEEAPHWDRRMRGRKFSKEEEFNE